jgi:hypothetical protein
LNPNIGESAYLTIYSPSDIAGLFSQILEARVGIEPALTDLQSAALPLCHRA